MAVFKCKMCGATLEVKDNQKIVKCDFCGATQTVYGFDSERKEGLFKRANALRFKCEFDKASVLYEAIISEFPKEAEAYWGLVLCKYGIEYVSDDKEHKIVPTCHRTQFASIYDDADYKAALQYSDSVAKDVYVAEANAINELQKHILEISSKEDPFDIFICYKESDDHGRTKDSVIAQDIYEKLTEKGYRVFFARITLEDKLGAAYEPYIFAALHSSKIMLHITTSAEHSEALWVRNEWSRYLDLIKHGQKKTLIPVFRDLIDVYDLPDEMENLQGVDMSKIGAMQDLIRGIGKIIKPSNSSPTEIKITAESGDSGVYAGWLKKGTIYLSRGDFKNADNAFDSAIFCHPNPTDAYLYKILTQFSCKNFEELMGTVDPILISASENYKFAKDFATGASTKLYEEFSASLKESRQGILYNKALGYIHSGSAGFVKNGIEMLGEIIDYKDAKDLLVEGKINWCILTLKEVQKYEEGQKVVDVIQMLETLPQDNQLVIKLKADAKARLEAIKEEAKKRFKGELIGKTGFTLVSYIISKIALNNKIASAFEPDDEEINEPCRAANNAMCEYLNNNCETIFRSMTTVKTCRNAIELIEKCDNNALAKDKLIKALKERSSFLLKLIQKEEKARKVKAALITIIPVVLIVIFGIVFAAIAL